MTWSERHAQSERLARAAEIARRAGDVASSSTLFRDAAKAEMEALGFLAPSETDRTYGVTAVSAVVLRHKAGDHVQAAEIARSVLDGGRLAPRARKQVAEMLAECLTADLVATPANSRPVDED